MDGSFVFITKKSRYEITVLVTVTRIQCVCPERDQSWTDLSKNFPYHRDQPELRESWPLAVEQLLDKTTEDESDTKSTVDE
ncbi:hypothetical protein NECAME_08872 [Necator americanus]|uniref:Uncharacterized protein n=1 Tax=Necator americanus TaxID=51031 RepID=W2TFX4_NECAM|nr:hypothetical protein NECAME_08872 [Necator americanus]ETN80940.1 hypothetical protein NECAME_08872 [Necator americanus]